MPVGATPSGSARNAANRLPSAAVRTRSSHTAAEDTRARRRSLPVVGEHSSQSQKAEMGAAIRAQRERHNVPRSIAPEPPPEPVAPPVSAEPERPQGQGLLSRLLRR